MEIETIIILTFFILIAGGILLINHVAMSE